MQGLITLLFLIGMFFSWYNQMKKKQQRAEELQQKRKETLLAKTEKIRNKPEKDRDTFVEDLQNRHIKSTIEYRPIKRVKRVSSLERIDRLSYIKKAIIWKEILDRP